MYLRIVTSIILILVIHHVEAIRHHISEVTTSRPQQNLQNPHRGKYFETKNGNSIRRNNKQLTSSTMHKEQSKESLLSKNDVMDVDETRLTPIHFAFKIKKPPSDLPIAGSKFKQKIVTDQATLKEVVRKLLEKFSLRVGQFKTYYQQIVGAMIEMRALRLRFYLLKESRNDHQQYRMNCLQLKTASQKVLNQLLGVQEELLHDFIAEKKSTKELALLLTYCLKETKSLFFQISTQTSEETLKSMRKDYEFKFIFFQSNEWSSSEARKLFAKSSDIYGKEWHKLVVKMYNLQSQFMKLIKIGSLKDVGSDQKIQQYDRMKQDLTDCLNQTRQTKTKASQNLQEAKTMSRKERDNIVSFADKVIEFEYEFSSHLELLIRQQMSSSKSTLSSTSSLSRAKSTLFKIKSTFKRRGSKRRSLSKNPQMSSAASVKSQTPSENSQNHYFRFKLGSSASERSQFRFKLGSQASSERSSFRLKLGSQASEKSQSRFKGNNQGSSEKSSARSDKSEGRLKPINQIKWAIPTNSLSPMDLLSTSKLKSQPLSKADKFAAHRSRSQSDLGPKGRQALNSSRNRSNSHANLKRQTPHKSRDKLTDRLRVRTKSLSQLTSNGKLKISQHLDNIIEKFSAKEHRSFEVLGPSELITPLTKLGETDKHLQITFSLSKSTKVERLIRIKFFTILEGQNESKIKNEQGLLKLKLDCSQVASQIQSQLEEIRKQKERCEIKKQTQRCEKKALGNFEDWAIKLLQDLGKIEKDIKNQLEEALVDSHLFALQDWRVQRKSINDHYKTSVGNINPDKQPKLNKFLSDYRALSLLYLQVEAIFMEVLNLKLFSHDSGPIIAVLLKQYLGTGKEIEKQVTKIQFRLKKWTMSNGEYQLLRLMISDIKIKLTLLIQKTSTKLQRSEGHIDEGS